MSRILIVEDNPIFREGARKYFISKGDIQVAYATDYNNAINKMDEEPRVNGAIIDCFFPYETGSNDISLGKTAIEKMLATDSLGQKVDSYEQEFAKHLDLDDELKKYARMTGFFSHEQNPQDNAIVKAVETVSRVSKEVAAFSARETLSLVCKSKERDFKDYYDALRKAIEKDESNQPLGILLAEECQKRDISFVLGTSTYHHDELTQPIQNYCQRKMWVLVDCSQNNSNEKATPEFWKRAFGKLERKIKQ